MCRISYISVPVVDKQTNTTRIVRINIDDLGKSITMDGIDRKVVEKVLSAVALD